MRGMRHLMGALFAAWSAAAMAADSTNALDSLRAIYDNAMLEIETTSTAQSQAWPPAYTNALRLLQARLQKGGDLDGWVTVKGELERFAREPTIPPDAVAAAPESLHSLQLDFQKGIRGIELDHAARIKDLADKYLNRLEALKKQYMIDGHMPQALAANQEITRVQGSAEVTSAGFVLAEEAANAPLRAPATAAPSTEKPAAAPSTTTTPGRSDTAAAGDDQPRIYAGQPPPPPDGISLQRMPLQRTSQMSLAHMVSVDAQKGTRLTGMDTSRGGGTYSTYETASGYSENLIRLGIRTMKSSDAIGNAVVVVQYFSQDAESKMGKVDPILFAVKRIVVPSISGKTTYVDFPPAALYRYSSSYHSSYGYSYSYKEGQRFYGVIVSVFDDSGAINFQGASTGNLVKMAPATPPEDPDQHTGSGRTDGHVMRP